MPPIDALANAALLKRSPSSANMANYADIFAGPEEGHVPTAWEQYSGDQNADAAETALGAGPAIDGLRRALDEQRLQKSADVQSGLDDQGLIDNDYLANGRNRAMAHADVANEVGDVNSEAAARRGFGTWATRAHERDFGDALSQADARYGEPARTQAAGNVAAAGVRAQGQMGAARAAHGDPVEALQKALNEMFAQGKSPEEVLAILPQLKQSFGIQ